MPFIHVSMGFPLINEEKQRLAEQLGNIITLIPGKTFEKTMIRIDAGCEIFRAGRKDRIAFVDTRLFQWSEFEHKQAYVRKIYELLENEFALTPKDVYFNIVELEHWGSRGDFR